MLNLGAFQKEPTSGKITGVLYGVNMLPTRLIFEPATAENGNAYYKAYASCPDAVVEAGAAWPKSPKKDKGKPYIAVKLSSPALAAPLYGKLFESGILPDQYHLLWDEPELPSRHDLQAEIAAAFRADGVPQLHQFPLTPT